MIKMTIISNKNMTISTGTEIRLKSDYPYTPIHIVNGCHVIEDNLYIDFMDGHTVSERQLNNLVSEIN